MDLPFINIYSVLILDLHNFSLPNWGAATFIISSISELTYFTKVNKQSDDLRILTERSGHA